MQIQFRAAAQVSQRGHGFGPVQRISTGGQFQIAQRSRRCGGSDVGVLLLTDHPVDGQWELLYMGLAPEARGGGE